MAVTVATFGLAGIDPSVALMIAIVSHATTLLACLPGGVLLVAHTTRERRTAHA